MDSKRYLEQVSMISEKVARKHEQIGMLRELVSSVSAPSNTERIISSGNQDKFASMMAKICDLEREIEELVIKKFEIISNIEKIDDSRTFKVIYMRYVNDNAIITICDELDISKRTVYSELDKGYTEIATILAQNSTNLHELAPSIH